ncbi:hypothetical protein N658DRAFT_486618 [Parathielavia hyrcaniae]|uniref:Uncharacterized protein n=1 Tax=Parathielavia hyrcaniae TaxID=113614 RepID=A0AAN6PZP8_9PEZI|nr:hypothetical protein N658DRAFT_486618 [Parathielavia hyrcaniae]
MVASTLALSLIGIGAVQALPAGNTVEERQGVWLGPGSGSFIPGNGKLPPCLTGKPLKEQPPCLLPPITGDIKPGKKRDVSRRQFIIGDGSGVFIPGTGDLPVCLVDGNGIPFFNQSPCLLPPIPGDIKPGKRDVGKRQFIIGDGTGVFIPGTGNLPLCLVDGNGIPVFNQPPCLLPPIPGGIKPGKKRGVDKRQFIIGDGSGVFIPGMGDLPVCLVDMNGTPVYNQPPCLLAPIPGVIKPGKKVKRQFTIGDGSGIFIPGQGEIPACLADVPLTEQPPCILPPIVGGLKPPTLPPKQKREFLLPPGKRDTIHLDTVGTYAKECPSLEGAQIALQILMHKDFHTPEEKIIMLKLAAFLKGCGITIVKSPDGTFTIIKPSDKRDASTQLNTKGLQDAYFALLGAASAVYPSQPSFANWLAIQQISGILELHGVATTLTVDSAGHPKRAEELTVGTQTCQAIDVMGLRAALAVLLSAYGAPSKAPMHIFLIEQVLVTALQLCGQSVKGWTVIIPGGSTVPGGPMVPDPTLPGGPMEPSDRKDRKRQVVGGDPAALLGALASLEKAYGTYGSGKIPVPVWLVMVNIVTILQNFPGVVVPGWPVLGQGSVVLTPST